jgi:hypothetical protein
MSEEPGAGKLHAGICAGAVRVTGRPTAMAVRREKGVKNEPAKIAIDYSSDIDSGACGWVWWEHIHSHIPNVSSNGYARATSSNPDSRADTDTRTPEQDSLCRQQPYLLE